MRTTMMPAFGPAPRRVRVDLPLEAALLGRLIPVTDPDLYAAHLPGETAEEREVRLAAARDITDDLVIEQAALLAAEVVAYTPTRIEAAGSAA